MAMYRKVLIITILLASLLCIIYVVQITRRGWDITVGEFRRKTKLHECDPNQVLNDLEQLFGVKIKKIEISSLQAAKSEGTLKFILKVAVTPEGVKQFVEQLKEKGSVTKSPIADVFDLRGAYSSSVPEWFTNRIAEGYNVSFETPLHYKLDVYVDTSQPIYLIYIRGFTGGSW